MVSKPKILLTLSLLITLALTVSSENHPARFDAYQETEHVKDDEPGEAIDYRLPKSIIPHSYDLKISKIDFETFDFEGTCTITAHVNQTVDEIILNAGSITVEVTSVKENDVIVNTIKNDPNEKTETINIKLERKLKVNSMIVISLRFNGKLRDDMKGFYRSSYYDDKGKQRWLAATQFEATHARHAFPCFDEPQLKAVFEISIKLPEGYNCLSNMPFELDPTTKWCHFEKSVKMSTYLVAFVISDFQANEPVALSKVKLWSRPNAKSQTTYGQSVGDKAVMILGSLFNEDYFNTMKKLDMVTIPDFSAGAMENWGLITYRETAGLYDENHSSDAAQQRVASVIVHEVSHMWFGNLVTPEWWSYLWLSEAFARYYQYMATNMIEPDWKMDEQFVVEQFQTAMAVDSVEDSKPMTRPDVKSPTQIDTVGDTIAYNKGASIVRMMEKTFGNKQFSSALKDYIHDRKLNSTTPDDLWRALQKHADPKLDVAVIMKTWTEQAGFPYITVSINSHYIILEQRRFFLRLNNDVKKYFWWVPITISSSSQSTEPVQWLSKQEDTIWRNNTADNWLVVNRQSAGFYRVNYDMHSWNKLIEFLTTKDFNEIDVINRAAIIDDLLNLARANIVDYELAFKALKYLKRETHYLPFKSALTGLDYLSRTLVDSPDYDYFKNFVTSLFKHVYDELTFDDKPSDNRLRILLRQELNSRVCRFDDALCISKSRKYFEDWKKSSIPVKKNQRSVVYCTAIRHGTDEDWEFLHGKFHKTNVAAEEITILSALGCSQNKTILTKYLLDALKQPFESSRIRKQDISTVFNGVYTASFHNAEFIIDFAHENHQALFDYHKSYNETGRLISGALQRYPIKRLVDKVDKLIKINATHIRPNVASIKKSLTLANHEIELFSKYLPPAIDSLKEAEPSTQNTTAYRLPGTIIPSSYDIHLIPYITPDRNFTFSGFVKIYAKVTRSTRKITLHADQLNIHNISISRVGDKGDVESLKYQSNQTRSKYDFFDIIMEDPIIAGSSISIELGYMGKLNTEMRGFYRSSYKIANQTRWLAATHLEPVGARRVFPSFDEPALKAVFDIKVQAPPKYSVISNTKVKSNTDGLYVFEPTPLMSTYLVAIVVSDFHSKSSKDEKHEYGVWANPLVVKQVDYALEVMGPVTRWFEEKLGHDYSLEKMDMIALPDFSSGAMENWGLLTYRETNLLYDPDRMSSIANKQSIRNVIAHEITHQWFGDLVSPLWWDYLWLNEGFARYFQCHAYTQNETAWNLEAQFVVDHLQTSFSTDGSTSTHPITHKVYSPTEIRAIFDKISYAKAASIIRMLEKLTGPTIFYKALNKYLKAREYNASTPEDLFKAFQTEINEDKLIKKFDVTKLMNSWTLQSGFPVLNVNFYGDEATITQTRFYQRPNKENSKANWLVPVTWATRSNPNFTDTQNVTFVEGNKETVYIKREKDDWVVLNLQQQGYYRVNYNVDMWNLIIKALNSTDYTKIHEINRANIIDDLLHLGRAGDVTYDLVFSGLSYLSHETEYIPWKAAVTGLTYLNRRFAGRPEVFNSYREFMLRLLEPNFQRLGLKDNDKDTHSDILLRRLVLDLLCNFDHAKCVSNALDLFKKERDASDAKNDVPPNYRSYVYCTAMKKGSKDDWEYLWKKYVKSDYATEKITILGALTCSQDPNLLKRLMDDTVKENSEIKLQDAKTVFSNIVNSGLVGVKAVLDYIPANYQNMIKYLGDDSIAKSTLNTISKRVSTNELFKQFEECVKKSQETMPEISKSLQSSLKRATEEMKWFKEKTPKIFEWLVIDNSEKKATKPDDSEYRLPTFAMPTAYDIDLKPYFEDKNFIFEGQVNIDVDILNDTSAIVLHSHGLKINEITTDPPKYGISTHVLTPTTQKLTITFKEYLDAGTHLQLQIKYGGVLRDDMRGLYRSSFVDEKNLTRWIASTHFEPAYTRQAFPCFDEPSYKAKFTLHISTPSAYHALSNMGSKPKLRQDGEKRVWHDFNESIKMSPYLVAFVVSEFVKTPDNPKRVAAWSRPQLQKYMKYAPPVGEQALEFLEKFTGIAYPLKEMNLVSIPDFDMGAMENWGLVTFREYGLTYDDQLTSANYKRYVNTVISHELVHMWFGNLVTCEWWDYTWLNEGFAEYISYLASDLSEPKWNLLKQFVVKELHVGLESDSSENSHPMNNKVVTPTQAQDGFDRIAYQKSASVLRMFHHSFGNNVFTEALHSYLDARKYNVARPEHLYAAIKARLDKETKVPGDLPIDVTTALTSWTTQAGYPVVSAVRKDEIVKLTQERFLISSTDPSKKKKTYWVPITYTTESEHKFENTEPKLWLGKEEQEIVVASKNKWFLLNVQEIGFYRVNYDKENWQALINQLNSDAFETIVDVNRAQIIDDTFNLARAGYINYELALNASKYLSRETNFLPWSAYFAATSYLSQRLEGHPEMKQLYVQHVLAIIDRVYKKLDLKEDMLKDEHLDQLNRELVITWACKYGHKDCADKATTYYKNGPSITPNIATAVYCTVVEHGDKSVWNEMWNKYSSALLATDYLTILRGLGCSKDTQVLKSYLERIVEPNSKIRRQDAGTAFSSIYTASQLGLNTTIDFIINNLDKLHDYYGNWHDVGSLLSGLAGRISNDNQIEILEKFAADKKAVNVKTSLDSAIKTAKNNLKWFGTHSLAIHSWLKDNYDGKEETPKPEVTTKPPEGITNAPGSAYVQV